MYEDLMVDPLTGELLSKMGTTLGSNYIIPMEVDKITCKEDYELQVKGVVANRRLKLWVSPFLLDVIVERQVSSPALGIYCLLGQSIGYSTYVYLTTKEMVESSGYVRQTIYKALDELIAKGFVFAMPNKLKEREDRFLMLNPLYFYVGYYPNRENALKEWMSLITKPAS